MNWNKSVEAHRFIWIFVRGEHFDFATDGGSMTTFDQGGSWKNDFIIGAVGASPDMANQKAREFSKKFNKWLLGNYDVEYEKDIDPSDAIEALAKAFAVQGSVLSSTGDIVDNMYSFPSERN
jgi:hypothetical protein